VQLTVFSFSSAGDFPDAFEKLENVLDDDEWWSQAWVPCYKMIQLLLSTQTKLSWSAKRGYF
jgi:hypothetical protein